MKMRKHLKIWIIPITLVVVLGFGWVRTAQAVEFDGDGVIPSDAVIEDDLFIAHDTVEINGRVTGDVFAAGGAVQVNGTIDGSLFTGSQTIILNGDVRGSVYAGAFNLTLENQATVGRNLYFGGFNLTAEENSTLGRDLLVGAYQALLAGEIKGDIQAGVGALEISGAVGGDVFAEVSAPEESRQTIFFAGLSGVETMVPAGIRVSEDATISGKLTYKSSQQQEEAIESSPAKGINYKYDPIDDHGGARRPNFAALLGRWLIGRLRVFLTLFILGGLVLWQLPGLLEHVDKTLQKETLSTLGWGLVTIIFVYVGAAIIAGLIIALGIFFGVITLGGLSKAIFGVGFSSLGLMLALFGILVSYVSKLAVSFTAGKLLLEALAPDATNDLVWPLILGIGIYVFLSAIPILGGLIAFMATILGVGAIWLAYRNRPIPSAVKTP